MLLDLSHNLSILSLRWMDTSIFQWPTLLSARVCNFIESHHLFSFIYQTWISQINVQDTLKLKSGWLSNVSVIVKLWNNINDKTGDENNCRQFEKLLSKSSSLLCLSHNLFILSLRRVDTRIFRDQHPFSQGVATSNWDFTNEC